MPRQLSFFLLLALVSCTRPFGKDEYPLRTLDLTYAAGDTVKALAMTDQLDVPWCRSGNRYPFSIERREKSVWTKYLDVDLGPCTSEQAHSTTVDKDFVYHAPAPADLGEYRIRAGDQSSNLFSVKPRRYGNLIGKIWDTSGVALRGATISTLDRKTGAYSRQDGSFSIAHLIAGRHRIQATALGYEPMIVEADVEADQNKIVNLTLVPASFENQRIEIPRGDD